MFGFSDILTLVQGTATVVNDSRKNDDVESLRNIRVALRQLHFSERTIERLIDLKDIDVGSVAISQRDSRVAVTDSLGKLLELLNERGLSMAGEISVDRIVSFKTSIRENIARTLHNAAAGGENGQAALISSIRTLNSEIELLDRELGGILI